MSYLEYLREEMSNQDPNFHEFKADITQLLLPEKLNFPFYYTPHELSILAAKQVQQYLLSQKEWTHNFGLEDGAAGLVIGKMFGVLVVADHSSKVGFLAAFSGKLAESNFIEGFVPPIYDTLNPDGFYKKGEQKLNHLNAEIDQLENSEDRILLQENVDKVKSQKEIALAEWKEKMKAAKAKRDQIRKSWNSETNKDEKLTIEQELKKESIFMSYRFKDLKKEWESRVNTAEEYLAEYDQNTKFIKQKRAQLSNTLQNQLFEKYIFKNGHGNELSLLEIFESADNPIPPAGTGECAAPKLFQYAFTNHYKPIALAEFWWGAAPKSQIRKSGNFYPACRSKCEPVLNYMLQGLDVEDNPMLQNPAKGKSLEIVYQDEDIAIINKPPEFLSVPGKNILDSVLSRAKKLFPEATGPIIVHRLDMSTSGIMILALHSRSYQYLQRQFIKRTISKRYVALLEGKIEANEGEIVLPLRVDLDNRPHQLVCEEHGKIAHTRWKKIGEEENQTRVHFFPITGRTHQLRVHAAHQRGLGTPIIGDDLYGHKGTRLHLHAEKITFIHPTTKKKISFEVKAEF